MNSKVWVENVPEEYDDMGDVRVGNKSILSYHVFLDSSNNFINITYSLHKRIPLSIELVNLLEKKGEYPLKPAWYDKVKKMINKSRLISFLF